MMEGVVKLLKATSLLTEAMDVLTKSKRIDLDNGGLDTYAKCASMFGDIAQKFSAGIYEDMANILKSIGRIDIDIKGDEIYEYDFPVEMIVELKCGYSRLRIVSMYMSENDSCIMVDGYDDDFNMVKGRLMCYANVLDVVYFIDKAINRKMKECHE